MSTINQSSGEIIHISGGQLIVPDRPIIPFIEGDGIGVDIWPVASKVIDAAVDQAYNGKRQIIWKETYAGGKAHKRFHTWLPDETIDTLKTYKISMKGPLTTPIGGGIRSLNVALRKGLDLYVCQRPVRWFNGAPSPMKDPSNVDMVIFRENTEDIYTGFEFEEGAEDTQQFVSLLKDNFPQKFTNIRFPDSSGFSIKPVSKEGTERLVDAAIQWALENNRKSVTFVHKGNIMKFTEGAFRKWGYELAEDRYADKVFTWRQWEGIKKQNDEETANRILELAKKDGKLIIKDIIADIMFEKALTHPHDFDVIATMNLNGDYLSDALVAQVGGVGIAPGANINYQTGTALFEATHGTAPAFAGKNVVNPGSMILSGEMMLRYMGWHEAADLIIKGIEGVIAAKTVTFDFYHLMENATLLKTDAYGKAIIHHMQ